MLRSFFFTLSKAVWAQRLITRWGFAWRMASRFVAGETPEAAIEAIRALNARGINATLDHLGENTASREDAARAKDDILLILDAIEQAGMRSSVSIKLSQIGVLIDPQLCRTNLDEILARAAGCHNFIRIDMEDSTLTEQTLRFYMEMHQAGYEQVGVVIQSYLYRSQADIQALMSQNARVRLVKGAYQEPASLAFPKKSDVDANYDRLAERLLDRAAQLAGSGEGMPGVNGRLPPLAAIATHDVRRIEHARAYAEKLGLPKEALEFQMLYGIRRDLQSQLADLGYPVRVYVPYGTHWYPYLMRRMAERPANAWFVLSSMVRR